MFFPTRLRELILWHRINLLSSVQKAFELALVLGAGGRGVNGLGRSGKALGVNRGCGDWSKS